MKKNVFRILPIVVLILTAGKLIAQKNIQNEWQKMHNSKKDALIEFNEAKFGMFIHWGVYSVPAGIWNEKEIPGIGEWIMYRANIPRKEYQELSSQFNPVGFDAEEWVKLAKDAGMKYIVCMPKHHDGFSMYHSKISDYNIYDATPFKRDPIDELYQACKKFNMRFGFYYSHAVDWMDGGDAGVNDFLKEIAEGKRDSSEYEIKGGRKLWPGNDWDPAEISFRDYLDNKSLPQVKELLQKFPDVKEIWFDVPRNMTLDQSFEFYKLVYDLQPQTLLNSRVGNDLGDFWIPGDNKIPEKDDPNAKMYWETPGTMNNTWGYKSFDLEWKSAKELIYWVVEICSKGGNYLLNIGPKPDGTIPKESKDILLEIGEWMQINGEACYGTEKWKINKEGPTNIAMKGTRERAEGQFDFEFTNNDFWFTQKQGVIYATALQWPNKKQVSLKSFDASTPVKEVYMLGRKKPLKWSQKNDRLTVNIPSRSKTQSNYGYVLKIIVE